jgi:hypothetical protein
MANSFRSFDDEGTARLRARASSRVSSFAAVQGTAAAELFSHKAKPPLTIPEHL